MNRPIPLKIITLNETTPVCSPFEKVLRENYLRRKIFGEASKTDCFRIYEKELLDYPLAIDYYGGRFCIHYFSQQRKEEEPSLELQKTVLDTLVKIFKINPDYVYWRIRQKNKETRQHEKRDRSQEYFIVHEYGVQFQVNLKDYLDTGLFLDHRETRQKVASLSQGKRLLNLFSYTGSFSIHAAIQGSSFTKSVDMSNTYTAWTEENFSINKLSLKHNAVIRSDCLKFLNDEMRSQTKYDVIVIDPPTISRSKKLSQIFDIQKDYIFLISSCLKLLNRGGSLFFSTNSRKFILDSSLFNNTSITEISDQTVPSDFNDKKIHRCWILTHE